MGLLLKWLQIIESGTCS